MTKSDRDPNAAFFNDPRWSSDFEQMLAAITDLAKLLVGHYSALIAEKVPRPIAAQLTRDLQLALVGKKDEE